MKSRGVVGQLIGKRKIITVCIQINAPINVKSQDGEGWGRPRGI